MTNENDTSTFLLQPIGIIKNEIHVKHHLPKQPREVAPFQGGSDSSSEHSPSCQIQSRDALIGCQENRGTRAIIECLPGHNFDQALQGIEGFDYIWVLFWMHQAHHWKPKILPPGCDKRIGLFATRSPHRPNPIGLSCVRVVRVKGLQIEIDGCDMLHHTPVLDLKPYLPQCDQVASKRTGWVGEREEREAQENWQLVWSQEALNALVAIADPYLNRHQIERVLKYGPRPTPSNRMKRVDSGLELALGSWRVSVAIDPPKLKIEEIYSGYADPDRLEDPVEREFHRVWKRK